MTEAEDPYKGWYNGFTMAERRVVNPLFRAALARGFLDAPQTCSICGIMQSAVAPIRMEWHLEDYRHYLRPYAICHSCHWTLHSRFKHPRRWARLIARHSDVNWVQNLTMDPLSKSRPFDETYPDGVPPARNCD